MKLTGTDGQTDRRKIHILSQADALTKKEKKIIMKIVATTSLAVNATAARAEIALPFSLQLYIQFQAA